MSHNLTQNDLFESQRSLFHPLTAQSIQKLANQKSILNSQFIIENQIIELQLFNHSLKLTFLNQNSRFLRPQYEMNLDDHIKAIVIQEKNNEKLIKSGFSLFHQHDFKYNFISSNEDIIKRWISELSKFLFLQGFSQDFKALKYLGRGEFGQVWEVQRNSDGQRFAAKIIDKDVCFGQVNGKEALYNEIQILRKLNHPNIVHLECVYEAEKSIYIVQELVEGKALSDFVRNNKDFQSSGSTVKLQKQHNVKIMKSLLKAVEYLHKIGIAHRDLKPGNIIINQHSKMPCIIDFGLSEFVDKEEYLFQYCGSPGYMAPEIFQEGKIKDIRKCDLFSLGAIFYLLLTQTPLFEGSSTNQIIQMTKQSKNHIKKKVKSSCSGPEANLLLQLLNQNPQKRATAEDALSNEFFIEAAYQSLRQIRKPTSIENDNNTPSIKVYNSSSKFQELFGDSALQSENNFKFHNFLNEEEEEDVNFCKNRVTPSDNFALQLKRKASRSMSEENIDVDIKGDSANKSSVWSGKWRKFKNFEQMLLNVNFWPVKDFISQRIMSQ